MSDRDELPHMPAAERGPLEEVCVLPGGYQLWRQTNGCGGYSYWTDEIDGGVCVYDTCLQSQTTMLIVLAEEARRYDAEMREKRKAWAWVCDHPQCSGQSTGCLRADCPVAIAAYRNRAADARVGPPKEPTDKMIDAVSAIHRPGWSISWRKVWRTMFDAWEDEGRPSPRRWRHKQRGTVYTEVCRGELQDASPRGPSEGDMMVVYHPRRPSEGDEMVVYRGDDGKVWIREATEFEDGRFEEIPK